MKRYRVLSITLLAVAAAVTGLASSDGLAQPKLGDVMQQAGMLVDINKASLAELEKVPGLNETLAKKVIGGRPFKSVDELLSKNVLAKDVFEKVKPLLTVSQ